MQPMHHFSVFCQNVKLIAVQAAVLLFGLCFSASIAASKLPIKADILLLKTYDGTQDVQGWLMSEKLDGVRGVWDGEHLRTKNGNRIYAPDWFIEQLPPFPIDGELWTKRSDFENIQSIVLRQVPDKRWQHVTFNIFEVPQQSGGLLERLGVLQDYLSTNPDSIVRIIPQIVVRSKQHVQDALEAVVAQGGEGLVLRKAAMRFYTGRQNSALKAKLFQDDECQITAYTVGKGKYRGLVGAINCDWNGSSITIGSGLKDTFRHNPPPIGTVITFKYYGLTAQGKPKFASFLRIHTHE